MKQYNCWCYECLKDMKEDGWPVTLSRMILCPDCGNKRCPKATNHNNACTNSNEPNQPGSRYSDDYPFTPKITHHAAAYQIHDKFKDMRIEQTTNYDPIVVYNAQHEVVFKITSDGNIFWKGREVQGDDELREATKEFMRKMTESMIPTYNPYNIGRDLYTNGKGISDIFGAVKKDSDIPEALRGYTDAQKDYE